MRLSTNVFLQDVVFGGYGGVLWVERFITLDTSLHFSYLPLPRSPLSTYFHLKSKALTLSTGLSFLKQWIWSLWEDVTCPWTHKTGRVKVWT